MAELNRQGALEVGRKLLDEFNINKVIIIDDDFFVDLSNKQLMREFCFDNDALVRKLGGPDLREQIENVEFEIENWFASSDEVVKSRIFSEMKKKAVKDILRPLRTTFFDIHAKQPECLCYQDWIEQKEDLIQNSKGILFIIDLDFTKENKSEDFGKELIETIKAESDVSAKFGLMSSHFKDAEEVQLWKERFGGDEPSEDYFPIAKNFEKNPTSLIRGLESLLLHQKLFPLSKITLKTLEISLSQTKEFIQGLDVYSLISILKSQESDGNWPIDGVAALSLTYMRPQITKVSRKFRKEIDDLYREAFGIINRCKLPFGDITKKKYRKKTAQAIRYDENINPYNLPISNGDIFQIGNQTFILLCQPCDLILRPNGTRFYETGSLFEIGSFAKGAELPFFSNDSSRVHFGRLISIPFAILDLCVLSSSGKAKLESIKKVLSKDLVPPEVWKIRLEELAKSFKSPKQYEVKGIADLIYDGKTRSYNLKRESRLLEPYASAMLNNLIQHLSRPVLPAEIRIN